MQQPFDTHAWITAQILGQGLDQPFLAKSVRNHHPQHAFGLVTGTAQLGFKACPTVEQHLGACVAALAIHGQTHAVGGALQQAQPQRTFQQLQPPADGWLGHAHLCRGSGQAACFDNAHKSLHQLDAITSKRGGA